MGIFADRTVVVTGAASGIGRALAELLARQGARVTLADINPGQLQEITNAIKESGGTATAATLDVTDFQAVKQLVDAIASEHKRLDFLFNNAGIVVAGDARDFAYEDWRQVIDVNLYGVVNGVAAAYPLMVAQGSGHIVNTASLAGLIPACGALSYTTSKYAVVGLSHALRVEAADLGVRVSVVCPGIIDTAINSFDNAANLDKEKMLASLPKGMTPEKCARIILRGVERNKNTILVTGHAKILWFLQRISPGLVGRLWRQYMRQMRTARLQD